MLIILLFSQSASTGRLHLYEICAKTNQIQKTANFSLLSNRQTDTTDRMTLLRCKNRQIMMFWRKGTKILFFCYLKKYL